MTHGRTVDSKVFDSTGGGTGLRILDVARVAWLSPVAGKTAISESL
jgi:hypothetical protein